jgi:hypothetical protein
MISAATTESTAPAPAPAPAPTKALAEAAEPEAGTDSKKKGKKGGGAEKKEKEKEKESAYEPPPNKWTLIKKPLRDTPKRSHEEMAAYMSSLNSEWLDEVKQLPSTWHMTNDERFDVMNRQGHYAPQGDPLMQQALNMVETESKRRADDHGPSISKDRFSSKYWRRWNSDYVLLEDLSRKEIEEESAKQQIISSNIKRRGKKLTSQARSHLPGSSFAPPKDSRAAYFDLHNMGNRNDTTKLFVHSLGQPLPASLHQTALLHLQANVDPDSFDRKVGRFKGGVINSGPARPPMFKPVTSNADMPPVDKPRGDAKLASFSSGPRSSVLGQTAAAGGGGSPCNPNKVPENAVQFARAARITTADAGREDGPGAGTYDVPRLFEGKNDPKPRDLTQTLINIRNSKDLRDLDNVNLSKIIGFGFGCNRHEHVLYGMCLDGLCGRRSQIELSMLQTNQYDRAGAQSEAQCNQVLYCQDVKPKQIRDVREKPKFKLPPSPEEKAATRQKRDKAVWRGERRLWTQTLVPESVAEMPPLHMAAHRGDCNALEKMGRLEKDINVGLGSAMDTPLHVAARKGNLDAVEVILRVFDGVVNINAQNADGDTPLHVAAREGRREITQALCEADADCLLQNLDGKQAVDETDKHAIKTVLRIQEDYQRLHGELKDVTRRRRRLERRNKKTQDLASSVSASTTTTTLDDYTLGMALSSPYDRGASAAASSRGSSRGGLDSAASERSKIMELGAESHYDASRESIKRNKSLFAVSATPKTLEDPTKNSYILGYFPPEVKAEKKSSFGR